MIEATFNPILKEEAYKNSFFPVIPIPGPKKAIILIASGMKKGALMITNDTKVKTADIKKGKYDQLVEIDLHPNNICIREDVVSDDNISRFTVTIMATASVTEPDVVYEEQIRDVAGLAETVFLSQIQDIASEFSIRDNAGLKRAIRDALGDVSYLGNGISINSISVNVQIDKKYEELLKNRKNLEYNVELETEKANAAKMMQSIYPDNMTAVFSQFAVGEITSEEAVRRSKKGLSEDFNERIRQIKEVTEYIKELERDEMINKGDTINNVHALLNGIVSSIPSIPLNDKIGDTKAVEMIEHKTEDNIYTAFEDEEE